MIKVDILKPQNSFLKEHIYSYRCIESLHGKTDITLYPDGCQYLLILSDPRHTQLSHEGIITSKEDSFLVMAKKGICKITLDTNAKAWLVQFKPGTFRLFFKINSDEVQNHTFHPARSLMHPYLHKQFVESLIGKYRDKTHNVTEDILVLLYQQNYNRKYYFYLIYFKMITASHGSIVMSEFAEQLGLSNITLDRRFKECLGVSPKKFSEMIRFQWILYNLKTTQSYSDSAALHVTDQSHYIKVFKGFTGLTPNEWLDMDIEFSYSPSIFEYEDVALLEYPYCGIHL